MAKKLGLWVPFGKKASPLYETVRITNEDRVLAGRSIFSHSQSEQNLEGSRRDSHLTTTGRSDLYWSPPRNLQRFQQSGEVSRSTNINNSGEGEAPQEELFCLEKDTESKRGTKRRPRVYVPFQYQSNGTSEFDGSDLNSNLKLAGDVGTVDTRDRSASISHPPITEGLMKDRCVGRREGSLRRLGLLVSGRNQHEHEVPSNARDQSQADPHFEYEMTPVYRDFGNTASAETPSKQYVPSISTFDIASLTSRWSERTLSDERRVAFEPVGVAADFASSEQPLMNGIDSSFIPDDQSLEKVGRMGSPTVPAEVAPPWPTADSGHGIAVASVVRFQSDPSAIHAVEFDPDAKPPRLVQQNSRFYLLALLFVLVAVVLVIGLIIGHRVVAITRPQGIPYRQTVGIKENVELWLKRDLSDDLRSPYAKALRWIVHDDPKKVVPTDSSFHQRFAVALFYFATSERGDWSSDCAATEFYQDNSVCSMEFNVLGQDTRFPGRHWLSGSSECEWGGVWCDTFGQVVGLGIETAGLNGKFPSVLSLLPFLKYIYLGNNFIEGLVPNEFFRRQRHLIRFEIWENQLTGPLPSELFLNGQAFDVARNKMNGTLHGAMHAPNLKTFSVSNNEFTGALPSRIGDGQSVADVMLHSNLLSGPIPESYGLLGRSLRTLSLKNNGLTGTIPDLGTHSLLKRVSLGSNNLQGTIPESLLGCSQCHTLKLENNMLTGTISSSLGKAQELKTLDLSGNSLTGTIPEDIHTISTLWVVYFEGNDLTGSVPSSLCSVERAAYGRAPIAISSDCRRSASGVVEIECACCTKCCEGNGRNCMEVD